MSIVGVKALLLAAATATPATALPFTPPAGWTQLPSSASPSPTALPQASATPLRRE